MKIHGLRVGQPCPVDGCEGTIIVATHPQWGTLVCCSVSTPHAWRDPTETEKPKTPLQPKG